MILLVHPEIPQNTGTLLRLGACLGIEVGVVLPCGFVFSDRKLKRAGLDYLDRASLKIFDSWEHFCSFERDRRRVLLCPRGERVYTDFTFCSGDILIVGRESDGVPAHVHADLSFSVKIPQVPGTRSLNQAIATALVIGEMRRVKAI